MQAYRGKFDNSEIGDSPELIWVNVAQLVIDNDYQREISAFGWKMINKIADGFNWSMFSPIIVAHHTALRFALIDGQHRVHAALLRGITEVPAMLVHASIAEQALAFASSNNNRVQVSKHQVYKASLAAGEGWAIAARDIASRAGCQLMTANASTANKRSGQIYGLVTIRHAAESGNGELMVRILTALRHLDNGNRTTLYSDHLITPIYRAMLSNTMLAGINLDEFFVWKDPYKILDMSRQMRVDGKTNSSAMQVFASQMAKFKSERVKSDVA